MEFYNKLYMEDNIYGMRKKSLNVVASEQKKALTILSLKSIHIIWKHVLLKGKKVLGWIDVKY